MKELLCEMRFLIHVKSDEPIYDWKKEELEIFKRIEEDERFEVLVSKPGGGLYRPTEQKQDGV